MSPQEQEQVLKDLVFDEYQTKKHIACLRARFGRYCEALEVVAGILEAPYQPGSHQYSQAYQIIENTEIKHILDDLQQQRKTLERTQGRIASIERPSQ